MRLGFVRSLAVCMLVTFSAIFQSPVLQSQESVRCGIDVLVSDDFSLLKGKKVGLITNHTGVAVDGTPSSVLLHQSKNVNLVALFSPEHGIVGKLDQAEIADAVDPATGMKVFSLYGANRKPTEDSLRGVDTLVFDIQDIGCRFYTYISTMGGAMEVAASMDLSFVVLDRPNPINGIDVAGPVLDEGAESFVGYHRLPIRHGMTVGEIAVMLKQEKGLTLDLEIVKCQGWNRGMFYDQCGLYWVNPSPNMRNLNQALLYPGIGVLEYTNISVGRGTDTPFEHIGAPWMEGRKLAAKLNGMDLPGVTFIAERFTPSSSKYENELCEGVQILITDRAKVKPMAVGLAVALALRTDYPEQWEMKNLQRLLSAQDVFNAIDRSASLDEVLQIADKNVDTFQARREQVLLYQ